MILVSGAAGKTGLAVISALQRRGESLRALVKDAGQAPSVRLAGAGDVVQGDMRQEATWLNALQGVRAVYHIGPNMHPDEMAMGRVAVAQARRVGVAHFVYHSVLHPQTEEMPHHWHKLRVEEAILASGLPFTILQPAAYMQNVLGGWDLVVREGIFRVPYPLGTELSLVDLEDVAAVAAIVLSEPGHHGATYELVGTTPLAQTEVAAMLAKGLGRPVQAQEEDLDTWRRRVEKAGTAPYAVQALVKMFNYYAAHGFAGNPRVLTYLLGRPPGTLRAFAQRQISHGN